MYEKTEINIKSIGVHGAERGARRHRSQAPPLLYPQKYFKFHPLLSSNHCLKRSARVRGSAEVSRSTM